MRPFHCTSTGLTPAITPNVGYSRSSPSTYPMYKCIKTGSFFNTAVSIVFLEIQMSNISYLSATWRRHLVELFILCSLW